MTSLNDSLLKPYVDAILAERDWSWSFIGILYLVSGMIIRSWFLGPVASRVRNLDRKLRYSVKSAYLKRSFWGWIFFFIPLAVIIVLWQDRPLPAPLTKIHLIGVGIGSFVFSIILHLQCFGIASLQTLRQICDKEAQKKLLEG